MSDGLDPKQWTRAFQGLPKDQLIPLERVEEIRNGASLTTTEKKWLCDSYATLMLEQGLENKRL
jgi:hypothetical protein